MNTQHPYSHDPEILKNAQKEPLACLGGCDRLRWLEHQVEARNKGTPQKTVHLDGCIIWFAIGSLLWTFLNFLLGALFGWWLGAYQIL